MTGRRDSRLFGRILAAMYAAGSYWVLAITAWILADVAGRVLLGRPFPGTAEMVAYSLPVITFLQIPHVLRAGQHLRTPILAERLGARGRKLVAILTSATGSALFVLAASSAWTPMVSAWTGGEYLGEGAIHIPTGPAWTVIIAGCVLMAAQFIGTLVRDIRVLVAGSSMLQEDE